MYVKPVENHIRRYFWSGVIMLLLVLICGWAIDAYGQRGGGDSQSWQDSPESRRELAEFSRRETSRRVAWIRDKGTTLIVRLKCRAQKGELDVLAMHPIASERWSIAEIRIVPANPPSGPLVEITLRASRVIPESLKIRDIQAIGHGRGLWLTVMKDKASLPKETSR